MINKASLMVLAHLARMFCVLSGVTVNDAFDHALSISRGIWISLIPPLLRGQLASFLFSCVHLNIRKSDPIRGCIGSSKANRDPRVGIAVGICPVKDLGQPR